MTLRMVCDGCGTSISPSTKPTLDNGLVFHARCIIDGEKELVSYLSKIGEVKGQLRDDGTHRWWTVPNHHRGVALEIGGGVTIVVSYAPTTMKWYIWVPSKQYKRVCRETGIGAKTLQNRLFDLFSFKLDA